MKLKTPLSIFIGITAFLFVVILVMITRFEKLKRQQSDRTTLAALDEADAEVLHRFEAFTKMMADNGWQVKLLEPVAIPDPNVLQLRRGSFRATLPDDDGLAAVVGVDAFTYQAEATLPTLTDDHRSLMMETWPELHPLKHGSADPELTVHASAEGRTLFVFYEYRANAELWLAKRFEEFQSLRGGEVERFHAGVQQRHREQQSQFDGIKMIQQSLLGSNTYQGDVDGVNGWRTKRAVQKFLRAQGLYEGEIDGVFGNRTLDGLVKFREKAGLSAKPVIDTALAEAVQQTLQSKVSASNHRAADDSAR